MEDARSASNQVISGIYPRYDAAVQGFRNYWYPVGFSRRFGKKPVRMTLLGEEMVLIRDRKDKRVYALHDRCPHRGIPLSEGEQVADGSITCPYHGWTYELKNGRLAAALSDAPDSQIVGKANVKTYPVEERIGLVWVYVGTNPAPPVEWDIPLELQVPNMVILGKERACIGNWRYAMENAVDEGHARYLHRKGVWTFFRIMPAWTTFNIWLAQEGEGAPWVERRATKIEWYDKYPLVGQFPKKQIWRNIRRKVQADARLPCTLRIRGETFAPVYHHTVPMDEGHYYRISTFCVPATGLKALGFKLWFYLYARWARFGEFVGQDQWMIEKMTIPPERLYGPDKSITFWRKYCNDHARGEPVTEKPPIPEGPKLRELTPVL